MQATSGEESNGGIQGREHAAGGCRVLGRALGLPQTTNSPPELPQPLMHPGGVWRQVTEEKPQRQA